MQREKAKCNKGRCSYNTAMFGTVCVTVQAYLFPAASWLIIFFTPSLQYLPDN